MIIFMATDLYLQKDNSKGKNFPCTWPRTAPWRRMEDWKLHIFLIPALGRADWSALRPVRFNPRETAAGIHCIRG